MMNKKFPILYGGDYNPDQWSEEIWKEDMRLFKLAHINLVTLPVFSWTMLQPSEDLYEFGWLDRILDLLAKNGIYACLATSTAAQPAWMSKKYPDMLPVDVDGRRRVHGKRVNFCPNSPVYRKFAARLAGKLAERYKNHPALLIWHIANEYGTYCYCDTCAKAFRNWVEEHYKTIEEVNRRWNLSFWNHTLTDWEEIVVPSELNDDNKWYQEIALDYDRFITDSTISCYMEEYRVIKAITPDIPITTNISGLIKHLDQFKFAKYIDIVGWDNYPSPTDDPSTVALKHDLMRGLKAGAPYLLVEQTPSQQNWQPYNKLKKPGEVRKLSYQAMAHGADAVMYFQLRGSIGGVEKFHGAVISHAGHENTRVFQECARIGAELSKIGSRFVDSRFRSKAAIIFDWDNWWSVELSSGPSKDIKYFEQINKYYKAFYDLNISVDIVRPDSDLSQYKIVTAPLLYMVKPGVDQNLNAFVSGGGTLISSFFSGIVDENDLVTTGGYPGKLRELFGIWVEEWDALLPEEKNSMVISEKGKYLADRYDCGLLCDLIHPETAKSLACYGADFYQGTSCLTVNQYGKGLAYYIGTDPDKAFLSDFVKGVCTEKCVTPPMITPGGVEVTRRYAQDGRAFTFLINHNMEKTDVCLDKDYRDMLTDSVISGYFTLPQMGAAVLENL